MLFRRLAPLVLCFLVALVAKGEVQPLMARDALVGKWKATLTTDDGKETTDNISFKAGKFTSENEAKDGFDPAPYEDDPAPQGLSAKFSVTLTNKAGDTATWAGFSTGNQIDGTLDVVKKEGSKTSYTLKAVKS